MIATHGRTGFLICLMLSACGDPPLTEYRLTGPTMGTSFTVSVVTGSEFDREQLQSGIQKALDDVDRRMSTYRSNSELAKFNQSRSTNWIPVSFELCIAVDNSLALGELTEGAFDITVGPLVNLWGFGPDGTMATPPSYEAIAAALSLTGRNKLQADCDRPAIRKDVADLAIDLSGYAKGLAADEIAALLDENGISNYLAEIGGDLRAHGRNASNQKWRVAIEKPDDADGAAEKIIHVSDLAVATSGDYRNFFEFNGKRYSHTIDPGTGRPVTHELASVTVLGGIAADADAMATALLVLGPEEGLAFAEHEGIAAYFLVRDGNSVQEQASTQFGALTAP